MSMWKDRAFSAIYKLDLPASMPLADRIAAVDAAYPFGERTHFPYKAWLAERRKYLTKFGYQPRGKAIYASPLERLMQRANA